MELKLHKNKNKEPENDLIGKTSEEKLSKEKASKEKKTKEVMRKEKASKEKKTKEEMRKEKASKEKKPEEKMSKEKTFKIKKKKKPEENSQGVQNRKERKQLDKSLLLIVGYYLLFIDIAIISYFLYDIEWIDCVRYGCLSGLWFAVVLFAGSERLYKWKQTSYAGKQLGILLCAGIISGGLLLLSGRMNVGLLWMVICPALAVELGKILGFGVYISFIVLDIGLGTQDFSEGLCYAILGFVLCFTVRYFTKIRNVLYLSVVMVVLEISMMLIQNDFSMFEMKPALYMICSSLLVFLVEYVLARLKERAIYADQTADFSEAFGRTKSATQEAMEASFRVRKEITQAKQNDSFDGSTVKMDENASLAMDEEMSAEEYERFMAASGLLSGGNSLLKGTRRGAFSLPGAEELSAALEQTMNPKRSGLDAASADYSDSQDGSIFGLEAEETEHRDYSIYEEEGFELSERLRKASFELFQHCRTVGDTAAQAAALVGGDEQLARIGGYFHEIGRLKTDGVKRNYIENGLIHLREYDFPIEIQEIVRQHSYKNEKPTSREAGVVMLSDSVYSTIAYMKKNGPFSETERMEMLNRMLNLRFRNGSLDESGLLLKDYNVLLPFFYEVAKEKIEQEEERSVIG